MHLARPTPRGLYSELRAEGGLGRVLVANEKRSFSFATSTLPSLRSQLAGRRAAPRAWCKLQLRCRFAPSTWGCPSGVTGPSCRAAVGPCPAPSPLQVKPREAGLKLRRVGGGAGGELQPDQRGPNNRPAQYVRRKCEAFPALSSIFYFGCRMLRILRVMRGFAPHVTHTRIIFGRNSASRCLSPPFLLLLRHIVHRNRCHGPRSGP